MLLASVSASFTSQVANHGVYAVFGLMAIDAVLPAASELVMVYGGALAAGAFAGQNVDLVYNASAGYYTLRDSTGQRWQFDTLGRLAVIFDPAAPAHTLWACRLLPRTERCHPDAVRPLDLHEDGRRPCQLEGGCRKPVAVGREGERRERVVQREGPLRGRRDLAVVGSGHGERPLALGRGQPARR